METGLAIRCASWVMTSPYLEKPPRSLQQALSECGRSPVDAGLEDPSYHSAKSGFLDTVRHTLPLVALVVAVFAVAAAGVVFINDRSQMMAEAEDDNIWNSNGVVPASGPDGDGLESGEYANPDAPPVEFEPAQTIE